MATVTSKNDVFIDTRSLKMWVRRRNKSRARILKKDSAKLAERTVSSGMNLRRKWYARNICLDSAQMDRIVERYM